MQVSSKLLLRTAIVLLGIMLVLTVFVSISNSQKASAHDTTDWPIVRGYVDDYFAGQYDSARGGEAGLIKGKLDLADDLNNDGDDELLLASYLDEGDDMANRPVLIDNLRTQTNVVPGTEFRCNWNANEDCFAQTSVDAVKSLVDAHAAAGFSTQVVDYCVSSHTASPSTAGWGIIAQTGALSSGAIPNVRELEWSRNGWTNTATGMVAPDGNQAIGAVESQYGTVPTSSALPDCSAETTDAGLVRCAANWAIASTGGNVGNGQSVIANIAAAGQTVDIRPGAISTLSTAAANVQIPLDTLFNTGLGGIDPTKNIIVASNTQHGGQAAMGLRMLGYTMVTGGYINSGVSRWEYDLGGEIWAPIGSALPKATVTAMTAPGKVDTTGPSVTSVAAENVTDNSADIHRVAGESATMKVEYGTAPGVYTNTANNTVLNADKTVSLTGLSGGTTYYYRTTSYDAYANGTVTVEDSLTTITCDGAPTLGVGPVTAFWASYADYTAGLLSVTYPINNSGATNAANVQITGSSATNGVTLATAVPVSVGSIAAGSSAPVTLQYSVPSGVTAFKTTNSASAEDNCANSYNYGPAV